MWRFSITAVVLAVFLVGCSADKDFEKDILGHPAPESSTDTAWPRTPPPPPAERTLETPPPPPAPTPAMAAPAPMAPAQGNPAPPRAQMAPAPAPAPAPAAPAAPAPAAAPAPEGPVLTFQVGSFAHVENAKELMTRLNAKGYTTRLDQGRLNNRAYFMVYASKPGSRAALEGELFANGVSEPVLAAEQPAHAPGGKAPAVHEPSPDPAKTFAAPSKASAPGTKAQSAKTKGKTATKGKAPAKTSSQPAPRGVPQSAPRAATPPTSAAPAPAPAPTSAARGKTTAKPPVSANGTVLLGVEPAPPLPDGYVPPPPKGSGS